MAWKMLFGTDFGLMSLIVIAGVIVIGVWLYRFIRAKMDEPPGDEAR